MCYTATKLHRCLHCVLCAWGVGTRSVSFYILHSGPCQRSQAAPSELAHICWWHTTVSRWYSCCCHTVGDLPRWCQPLDGRQLPQVERREDRITLGCRTRLQSTWLTAVHQSQIFPANVIYSQPLDITWLYHVNGSALSTASHNRWKRTYFVVTTQHTYFVFCILYFVFYLYFSLIAAYLAY